MLQSRCERGCITCGKRQVSLVIAGHAAVVENLAWFQEIIERCFGVISDNYARRACFCYVVPWAGWLQLCRRKLPWASVGRFLYVPELKEF